MDAVLPVYKDAVVARFYNECVVAAVRAIVDELPTGRLLRVLEIGAGTGGTAASVLPALRHACACYTFTDVSESFLRGARAAFAAEYPFVEYELLNIDADPRLQGFSSAQYDLIITTNTLHATPFMRNTLRSCRQLLSPGGLLVVNEVLETNAFAQITFGMTDGWWLFASDPARAGQQSPLMSWERWCTLFADAGFAHSHAVRGGGVLDGQAVMVARVSERGQLLVEPQARSAKGTHVLHRRAWRARAAHGPRASRARRRPPRPGLPQRTRAGGQRARLRVAAAGWRRDGADSLRCGRLALAARPRARARRGGAPSVGRPPRGRRAGGRRTRQPDDAALPHRVRPQGRRRSQPAPLGAAAATRDVPLVLVGRGPAGLRRAGAALSGKQLARLFRPLAARRGRVRPWTSVERGLRDWLRGAARGGQALGPGRHAPDRSVDGAECSRGGPCRARAPPRTGTIAGGLEGDARAGGTGAWLPAAVEVAQPGQGGKRG